MVERAFATVLTTPGDGHDIEGRLCSAVRKLSGRRDVGRIGELPPADLRVSRDLHLRILDAVDDWQYTTRPARSRLILVGVALFLVAAAGVVQLQRTRSDALAGSVPTIVDAVPAAGAVEVPLDGEFRIQFSRRPIGTPTISHLPPDGKQSAAHWDGTTLIVDYVGLHFGSSYQLVLSAQYNSPLRDTGLFEKRWSFTAEGAPHLVSTVPVDGDTIVARNGLLTVEFSKRPSVEPTVTLSPGATHSAGVWNGTTWKVQYTNLQPLTRYTATVTLLPPDRKGHIHSDWSFETEPGAPPVGVPVVWYSTSSHSDPAYLGVPNRLVAIDWTGKIVGTLYAGPVGRQNPDGSWIATQDATGVIDGSGQMVAQNLGNVAWSETAGRYCAIGLSPSTGQTWLKTGIVGGSSQVVAQLGSARWTGQTPIACSIGADRSVVGNDVIGGFVKVRIFSLSTGHVLYQRDYSSNPVSLVSSHDGRYLGESSGVLGQSTAGVIRRTSDGAVVARLGSRRVVAFSWDGSLVLTGPASGTTGPADVRLVNWRTGAVLWQLSGDPQASGQAIYSLAQPNGSSFIVALGNPSGPGDVDGLFLVHADGRAEKIVSGAVFLAADAG